MDKCSSASFTMLHYFPQQHVPPQSATAYSTIQNVCVESILLSSVSDSILLTLPAKNSRTICRSNIAVTLPKDGKLRGRWKKKKAFVSRAHTLRKIFKRYKHWEECEEGERDQSHPAGEGPEVEPKKVEKLWQRWGLVEEGGGGRRRREEGGERRRRDGAERRFREVKGGESCCLCLQQAPRPDR